jgi:hypothetical protein
MAGESRATGTSLTSFEEATENAFSDVPGDPDAEGVAAAEIVRMWVSKGTTTRNEERFPDVMSWAGSFTSITGRHERYWQAQNRDF